MKYFLILFLVGLILSSNAQKKIEFSSINNYGLIIGDKKTSSSVQTINGVKWDDWMIGIGAGIDWHNTRSVPLFLDLRKYFLEKRNQPFVYIDGGISIPWLDKDTKNWYSQYDFKNTFYGEIGGGYKLQILSKKSVLLSAGYGLKKEIIKYKGNSETSIWDYGINRFDYKYQRIIVRIGVQL